MKSHMNATESSDISHCSLLLCIAPIFLSILSIIAIGSFIFNKVTFWLMEAITFYKYVRLSGLANRQMILKHFCIMNKLKGTIMLSKEGINGAISGSSKNILALKKYFKKTSEFHD